MKATGVAMAVAVAVAVAVMVKCGPDREGISLTALAGGVGLVALYFTRQWKKLIPVILCLAVSLTARAQSIDVPDWTLPGTTPDQQLPSYDPPFVLQAAAAVTVVVGGGYAAYKIWGWAKKKLYPTPKIPTNSVATNAPALAPDDSQGQGGNGHPIIGVDPTETNAICACPGDVLMPDGEPCGNYATTDTQSSMDGQNFKTDGTIDLWWNADQIVCAYRGFVAIKDNPWTNVDGVLTTTVTVGGAPDPRPQAFYRTVNY